MNQKNSSFNEEQPPLFSFSLDNSEDNDIKNNNEKNDNLDNNNKNSMCNIDNDSFNIRDRINAYKNWRKEVPVLSNVEVII